MKKIEAAIKKVISEQLGISQETIKPHSELINDLGADSLDTVELIMAFEETFEIDIPDDIAEKIMTVQDAIDFVATKNTLAEVV